MELCLGGLGLVLGLDTYWEYSQYWLFWVSGGTPSTDIQLFCGSAPNVTFLKQFWSAPTSTIPRLQEYSPAWRARAIFSFVKSQGEEEL